MILNSGDKVPADIRLVHTDRLKVEESPLTRESTSVEKQTDVLEDDTPLGDRINMVFSGTTVSSIPEGLPAISTIILALGVQSMADKNAIMRTLPSVETLGALSSLVQTRQGRLQKMK